VECLNSRLRGKALAFALALVAGPAAAQVVQLRESAPRTFGYQVGDLVERHAEITVPRGLRLGEASLPVSRPGASLELREAGWEPPPWWHGGDTYRLHLRYQVLRSPPSPRLMDLPPVVLRFQASQGEGRTQELRLDGVPIMVSPLVPEPPPQRNGFGPLQEDMLPLLIAADATRLRLAGELVVAALLLGTLALGRLGWPGRRRQRPFADAWRALRRLPAAAGIEEWRQALAALHRALNRAHGEVLFAQGLDAFLARQPAFAPLRPELERFFYLSRQAFFAPGGAVEADAAWLKALCRRARALERDAA
jgi:mxaA protein